MKKTLLKLVLLVVFAIGCTTVKKYTPRITFSKDTGEKIYVIPFFDGSAEFNMGEEAFKLLEKAVKFRASMTSIDGNIKKLSEKEKYLMYYESDIDHDDSIGIDEAREFYKKTRSKYSKR